MGLGTVGTEVGLDLQRNRDRDGFIVERILVTDPDKHLAKVGNPHQRHQFTVDPRDIYDNPDIDMVVELMGGTDPAENYILRAIENGKWIVTANKALLAVKAKTIFDAAIAHQVEVGYDASVAGKIPIIANLEHLDGEEILQIDGILNGTSNYILTRMDEDGMSYPDAVQEAKDRRFAEKDESRDVKGEDPADKIIVLATTAWKTAFDRSKIKPTGIDIVTPHDMRIVKRLGMGGGYVIKPISSARRYEDGTVGISVSPMLVRSDNRLATVRNENNGIIIYTAHGGPITADGPGAGGEATSVAVLADMRRLRDHKWHGYVKTPPALVGNIPMLDADKLRSRWYLRVNFSNREGVWEEYGRILRENHLSGQHSMRDENREGDRFVPDYDTIDRGERGDMMRAAARLAAATDMIAGVPYVLPIL